MSTDVVIRYGVLGQADITGLLPTGRRVELEVKTGSGVLSDGQIKFSRMITEYGGLYFEIRDIPSALNFLRDANAKSR